MLYSCSHNYGNSALGVKGLTHRPPAPLVPRPTTASSLPVRAPDGIQQLTILLIGLIVFLARPPSIIRTESVWASMKRGYYPVSYSSFFVQTVLHTF